MKPQCRNTRGPRIGLSFFRQTGTKGLRGFTLIELLIVIAIILILIAIALPNFLEAQIRAKVTKAKAELRSIHTAMESYFLDWKVYPAESESSILATNEGRGLTQLTSPNPYLTGLFEDPFSSMTGDEAISSIVTYELGGIETIKDPFMLRMGCTETWAMWSKGPDYRQNIWAEHPHHNDGLPVYNYSPTNGTDSAGSIFDWGGDSYWIGVHYGRADRKRASMAPQPGLVVDDQVYLHRLPHY